MISVPFRFLDSHVEKLGPSLYPNIGVRSYEYRYEYEVCVLYIAIQLFLVHFLHNLREKKRDIEHIIF